MRDVWRGRRVRDAPCHPVLCLLVLVRDAAVAEDALDTLVSNQDYDVCGSFEFETGA